MSSDPGWVISLADMPSESAEAIELVGAKAAMLADLVQAGLAPPGGFVLTTAFVRDYLEHDRQWPKEVSPQIRRHLKRLEKDLGRSFGKAPQPLLLAVRLSMPPDCETPMRAVLCCGLNPDLAEHVGDESGFWNLYLRYIRDFGRRVHGLDADALDAAGPARIDDPQQGRGCAQACFEAFKKETHRKFPTRCWDQFKQAVNALLDAWARTTSANATDLDALLVPAVVVEPTGPLWVRAVVFTADPDDPLSDHVRIEAQAGPMCQERPAPPRETFFIERGEAVENAGLSTGMPPSLNELIGDRPSVGGLLSEDQQRHLAYLALRIERYLSGPVAATFAVGTGHVALLGARVLGPDRVAREVEAARTEQMERLARRVAEGCGPWVRCALDERLTHPTTLTWDLVRRLADTQGSLGRLVRTAGYRPHRDLNDNGFLERIAGRVFADAGRVGGIFFPTGTSVRAGVFDDDDGDDSLWDFPPRWPSGRAGGHVVEATLSARPVQRWILWRADRRCRRLERQVVQAWRGEVVPRYLDWVAEEQSTPLSTVDDAGLLEALERCCQTLLDEYAADLFLPGWLGPPAFNRLRALLEQVMGPEHGRDYALTLTQALDDDATYCLGRDLAQVAAGANDLETFLAQYGHRAAGELELATARWRGTPGPLERMVRRLGAATGRGLGERLAGTRLRRSQALEDLPSHLQRWGGATFEADIRRDVAIVQGLLACRESAWHFFMMGYDQIRRIVEELGRRAGLGGHVFDLHYGELLGLSSGSAELAARARQRARRRQATRHLKVPGRIETDHLDELFEGDASTDNGGAVGRPRPLSPGLADGPVRIVSDPAGADVEVGEVLVCRAVDAGWMPLLLSASALVVEQGGLISTAAMAARALGVPAITWPGAMDQFRSGWVIRVDGHAGRVVVMEG